MTADDMSHLEGSGFSSNEIAHALVRIEEQPLSSRATSYKEVQEVLRSRLEGADVRR